VPLLKPDNRHLQVELPPVLKPMMARRRWLVWRWEWRGNKRMKPPIDSRGRRVNAHDFDKLMFYEDACELAARIGDGLGFQLLRSGIGAFDLDNCIDVGGSESSNGRNPSSERDEYAQWALGLVTHARSYVERTPSGNGLRILGLAQGGEVHTSRRMPIGKLEIFRNCKRYVTVSGDYIPLGGDELVNIDALIDELAPPNLPRVVNSPEKRFTTRGKSFSAARENVSPLSPLAIVNKHKINGLLRQSLLNAKPVIGRRSDVMWWQARCLVERELPPEEMYVLLDASHWNKHAGELRNEQMIWTLIEKASSLPFTPWRGQRKDADPRVKSIPAVRSDAR
jgi:hypothetical protein